MIKEKLSEYLYDSVYRDVNETYSKAEELEEIETKVEYFFGYAQSILMILDAVIIYFIIRDNNSVELAAGVIFFVQIFFYTLLRVFEKFLKEFRKELVKIVKNKENIKKSS